MALTCCLLIRCIKESLKISTNHIFCRDFAYVARDPNTGKHKCHIFRCHGNISGRAITNALHEMCSRILEEKKRAKHEAKHKSTDKQSCSDIINTPPPPSAKGWSVKPAIFGSKVLLFLYLHDLFYLCLSVRPSVCLSVCLSVFVCMYVQTSTKF